MPGIATLLLDDEGRVTRANAAAERMFGSCAGRPCDELVGSTDAAGHTICTEACRLRVTAGGESDLQARVGTTAVHLVCTGGSGSGVVVLIPAPQPTVGLTPREHDVLERVVAGRSVREIAAELGIGFWTVRSHLDHVKEKLGVHKSTELVCRALALGLAHPSP